MATGRKTVVVGQVIDPDAWGNPLWDQSVQTFASDADRTTQFPAAQRKAGAVTWLDDVKRFEAWDGAAWKAIPTTPTPTPYVPTWASTGSTQPVLGNGTLRGRRTLLGTMATFRLELTIGSTTTLGQGTWAFGLPYPSAADYPTAITGRVLISGTEALPVAGVTQAGAGNVWELWDGKARLLRGDGSYPFPAASILDLAGTYETSLTGLLRPVDREDEGDR